MHGVETWCKSSNHLLLCAVQVSERGVENFEPIELELRLVPNLVFMVERTLETLLRLSNVSAAVAEPERINTRL